MATRPPPDRQFITDDTTFTGDASNGLYIRVPGGFEPNAVRIGVERGGDFFARPSDGNEWFQIDRTVADANPHYDYYVLVNSSDSSSATFAFRLNDVVSIEISDWEHTLRVPLDELTQSGASDDDVVDWNATTEEWEPTNRLTGAEALLDATAALARHAASELEALDTIVTGDFELMAQEDVDAGYAAAFINFGQNEHFGTGVPPGERFAAARSPIVYLRVPGGIDPNHLVGAVHRRGGTDFAADPGDLVATYPSRSTGTRWYSYMPADADAKYDYWYVGSYTTLPISGSHRVDVLADDYIVMEIRAAEHVSGSHTEARFQALEDKTSHIDFDENPTWVAADNTPDDDGKYPYGKWAWIHNGQTAANYAGLDYADDDDFTSAAGDGFGGAGSGLLWVLPNNLNWSHLRLRVLRDNGTVRSNVIAQGLRNAPSTLIVANLPSGSPDVTVRWSASSDTHPFAVSNIEPTDTVVLEVLPTSHVPVWAGEISDRLRDRVAANEARFSAVFQNLHIPDPAAPAPRATLTIDETTTWVSTRSEQFSVETDGMMDSDIIKVEWENLTLGGRYSSYANEGSTSAAGTMWLHYRDLGRTAPINGRLGDTTGVARTTVSGSLVDDPLGSRMHVFLFRATTARMLLQGELAHLGSQNENTNGRFPANLRVTVSTWRSS